MRAALLAIVVLIAAASPGADGIVAVTHVGPTVVTAAAPGAAGSATALSTEYLVEEVQRVSGRIRLGVQSPVWIYPLVRGEGDSVWQVQTAARRNGPDWTGEINVGRRADTRRRFELQVVVTSTPLARGQIPPDMLARMALALSSIVKLRRRVAEPSLWVPSINGRTVHRDDGEILDVGYQAPIEVRTRDLPHGARAGVAIQPLLPWSDAHWVMVDTLSGSHGVITGHFGMRGMHNHHQFRVVIFATMRMPPAGVPIGPDQWAAYEREFLAPTHPITVWRWEGETRITHVNGVPVLPKVVMAAESGSEIRGTIRWPLGAAERIWLVCVPRGGGDPWIGGWTATWQGGGRWTIHIPTLDRLEPARSIDLIAIISADDPTKRPRDQLRAWVNDARERSVTTVRIRLARLLSGVRTTR